MTICASCCQENILFFCSYYFIDTLGRWVFYGNFIILPTSSPCLPCLDPLRWKYLENIPPYFLLPSCNRAFCSLISFLTMTDAILSGFSASTLWLAKIAALNLSTPPPPVHELWESVYAAASLLKLWVSRDHPAALGVMFAGGSCAGSRRSVALPPSPCQRGRQLRHS